MSEATADAPTKTPDGAFVRSRLGSFLAVFPLGLWTVGHLWNNLAAFKGGPAWQTAVTEYPHPLAHLVTMVVVLLPLVLHMIWGISRMAQAQPNLHRHARFNNFKYVLQRLSAIGLMLFLGAHIWLAMLHPRFVEGHPEPFADIAKEMRHHGPTLAVYVLGTLGVAFHLANGLHTFTMGWGVVASRRAIRRLDGAVIGLFLALLAMGWAVIYALWSAGA